MESSVNKYEVQEGTKALTGFNEDGKIKLDELKSLNGMNLKGMIDWSAKERTRINGVPDSDSSKSEFVGVLDKFDAQIDALKKNYEASRDAIKSEAQGELAKLEAAIGIAKPEPAKAETATPAAAPAEAKEAPKTAEYVVKPGDNLTKVAKEHGTTVDALVKENGIKDKNRILVGQKLKVPAKAESQKATDAEAAKATAKPVEAEKKADGKPADGGKAEKKADAPATKGETDAKAAAKAGEVPPATATVAEKAKVATPNPEPTKMAYANTQAPIGGRGEGAAGGTKKNGA